jgi:flagellar biosynthesis protein FlhG
MVITPKYCLADVMNGSKSLEQILTQGPLGIQFISGGSGVKELVKVTDAQLNFFIQNLSKLDNIADIILVDTGAGLSNSVMSFVKAVDEVIVVTTPEPTAITDAYSLIKVLKNDVDKLPQINVIINRVDDEVEGKEIFEKLNKVTSKFLKIELKSLGYVPYDSFLVKAVKSQQPVTLIYPKAASSKAFENIGNKLLDLPPIHAENTKGITSFIKRLVSSLNV